MEVSGRSAPVLTLWRFCDLRFLGASTGSMGFTPAVAASGRERSHRP
jgi:hypothetical protein